MTNCKSKTLQGKQCKNKAVTKDGYCNIHKTNPAKEAYGKFVDAAFEVCAKKGWQAYLVSNDSDYELATIEVRRDFDHTEVTGLINLRFNDEAVQYNIEKTSFHNYGLSDLLKSVNHRFVSLGLVKKKNTQQKEVNDISTRQLILTILKNFHRLVIHGKRSYGNRLDVSDEAGAQKLLLFILRAYFDDVRKEEFVPSLGVGNSRADFFLRVESIFIEVKFATEKLKDRGIVDQLLIDIGRYQ